MVTCAAGTFARRARAPPHSSSSAGKRRKGKKKRKRRTPRTSSYSSRGRGHRRLRQWYVHGWFCCFGTLHAVLPSFVGRPQLLGIMDDMDQNGSSLRALVFDSGSGIFRCGFCWVFLALLFLCVAVKPKMLRIMAGMAQKDSHAAGVAGILAGFARYAAPRAVFPLLFGSAGRRILAILAEEVQAALVVDNSGMFMVGFARDDALHAVFPSCCQAPDACHHGRYGPARAVHGAVQKTSAFPQLQYVKVIEFPVVTPRLIPMVLVTVGFRSCYSTRWSMSLFFRSCRFSLFVVQRPIPMVRTVCRTFTCFSSTCFAGRAGRRLCCRGAEASSRGPDCALDH